MPCVYMQALMKKISFNIKYNSNRQVFEIGIPKTGRFPMIY
jgi:hypothetical protein